MKNVYFVQVDISASLGTKSAYLPYTAGILAAGAWSSEIVQSHYLFKEFIFLRDEVGAVVSRLENPAVVAFSNYVWNTEYNKALAAAIKVKHPHCIIIFGGHNVPDDFSFLEQFPFIDYLIHGEGEEALKALLEALAQNTDLYTVPNLSMRTARGEYLRTPTRLPKGLNYPSPYLEGWFDTVLQNHPEITFNAILETSRGCAHQCAYCDWGLLKSKVRLFPIERVKAEINWMSEHKIAFVWGADANFGLFSRDLEIADALVAAKEKTGYPERMRINYAKDNYKNVFEIVKKFKACDFDRIGATLSFQSLSPVVLKNIGRTNDTTQFYQNLLTQYKNEGMKTYSELILGLPGETYESFISGIGKLFEIGQHFVFETYTCILLPNSVLGKKETIERFGIQTTRAEILRSHSEYIKDDVPEYINIITSTNTMSREQWVRSVAFSNIVKAFHGNGLLRVFAIYLYFQKQIPYERFYDNIIDYLEAHPSLHTAKLFLQVKGRAEDEAYGKDSRKLFFQPCGDIIWDDHEYLVLHLLQNLDGFFDEMMPFLRRYDISPHIFHDLLLYQKNIIRRPGDEESVLSLQYDIHGFLNDAYVHRIHAPHKKKHQLKLRDSQVKTNWLDFGKMVIWYGRMGWSSYKDDISEVK